MSGSLGELKNRELIKRYIDVCLEKVELAYGVLLTKPKNGFVPYESTDEETKRKIENYFNSITKWSDVSLDKLIEDFPDDYWSIFHHVGWEGIYCLTPILIKLAYEGYLESDEIVSTVERLFSRFPRLSDDSTANFLDWMNMYDQYQILCVLDLITLLSNDPLALFPDGFKEGKRWWMRYYVDG
jgi:hypothetical protein